MRNHKPFESFLECSPECPEEEAGRVRNESILSTALVSAGVVPDNNHFSLADLRRLADERRACAGEWDLPVHLAGCPVCLDAFQVLLEGAPQASPELLSRSEMLFASVIAIPKRAPRIVPMRVLAWAACFLILASATVFLRWYAGSMPVLVKGNALVDGSDAVIAQGKNLFRYKHFMAGKDTTLEFSDGSVMELLSNARFAYSKSVLGSETVSLGQGSASFVIKRRKPAQPFKVATPIGEITVIGTRFTVVVATDKVRVFETSSAVSMHRTYDDRVARVMVKVEEGTVGVSNHSQSIRVPAGQTAVIWRDKPWIQVMKNESGQ